MTAADTSMKIVYKAHTSSAIIPGTEPVFSSDPGTSGGQELRRGSSSLNFKKSTFKSNEIRSDMQIFDFRHGGKRVSGEIVGELSPKTFQDFMAAVVRGNWAASISKDNTVFTSVTATASTSKFTVAASTWAAQGFRVGDVIRFVNLSTTTYNNKNWLITALSGVDATVSPAIPTDMAADSSFTVSTTGRKLVAPTSNLVSTKWAFEENFVDVDITHLYTECRIGSMKIGMPAEGIATVSVGVLGRNMTPLTGARAPFFTAPTGPTTTSLLTSIGGQMTVAGAAQAIITGAELNIDLSPSAPTVAFSPLVPEVYLGELDVSGQITALFNDNTLINYFINETEVELALVLATSNADNADYINIFLPRVKLGGSDLAKSGEAGIPITMPFQALLKPTTTGYDSSTLTIGDSLSA